MHTIASPSSAVIAPVVCWGTWVIIRAHTEFVSNLRCTKLNLEIFTNSILRRRCPPHVALKSFPKIWSVNAGISGANPVSKKIKSV